MYTVYEEGDLAIVTTKSGHRYVGEYTIATGIGGFWSSVVNDPFASNQLQDPDVSVEYLGHREGI